MSAGSVAEERIKKKAKSAGTGEYVVCSLYGGRTTDAKVNTGRERAYFFFLRGGSGRVEWQRAAESGRGKCIGGGAGR